MKTNLKEKLKSASPRSVFKPFLLDNKYRIVEAFELDGIKYYMFDSQYDCPTGRQMAALAIYEEMRMNCDKEYLEKHCRAMEKIMSDNKKGINLNIIIQLNINLKERLELMPLPGFIYKLASVVFFDDTELLYSYDYQYNEKKIAKWKEVEGTLDFFLKSPMKELVPSLRTLPENINTFFPVANLIDKTHQQKVSDILLESQ